MATRSAKRRSRHFFSSIKPAATVYERRIRASHPYGKKYASRARETRLLRYAQLIFCQIFLSETTWCQYCCSENPKTRKGLRWVPHGRFSLWRVWRCSRWPPRRRRRRSWTPRPELHTRMPWVKTLVNGSSWLFGGAVKFYSKDKLLGWVVIMS